MASDARAWLADRLGLKELLERAQGRLVPSDSPSHFTGGVVVFLFLLQVATGILLMLPYRVDPAHAHASVEAIVGQVPFGSLMRGIHAWASHLFIATLFLHFAAAVLGRRYRAPNELVWMVGQALLVAGIGLAFTGIILPWNENGYLQARVSSEILGQAPLFGPFVRRMLRGGDDLTPWTLNHAFGFHTGVLPAATTMLILLHALLQRRSAPAHGEAKHIPLYPDFVLRMAALCTGVMALVVTLATFVHLPTGAPADLRAAVTDTAPPWYLLFVDTLIAAAPPQILGVTSPRFILGVLTVIGAAVVGLPFIDRRGSRITVGVALAFMAIWGVLTAYAAF